MRAWIIGWWPDHQSPLLFWFFVVGASDFGHNDFCNRVQVTSGVEDGVEVAIESGYLLMLFGRGGLVDGIMASALTIVWSAGTLACGKHMVGSAAVVAGRGAGLGMDATTLVALGAAAFRILVTLALLVLDLFLRLLRVVQVLDVLLFARMLVEPVKHALQEVLNLLFVDVALDVLGRVSVLVREVGVDLFERFQKCGQSSFHVGGADCRGAVPGQHCVKLFPV